MPTRQEACRPCAPNPEALLAAMDLIATVLNRTQTEIRSADPDAPEAIACLSAYFQLLADKIPTITPDLFPLPDPHADTFRPPKGQFLIAYSDTLPSGCVSLRPLEPCIGEVKTCGSPPMPVARALPAA